MFFYLKWLGYFYHENIVWQIWGVAAFIGITLSIELLIFKWNTLTRFSADCLNINNIKVQILSLYAVDYGGAYCIIFAPKFERYTQYFLQFQKYDIICNPANKFLKRKFLSLFVASNGSPLGSISYSWAHGAKRST